jgi:S1-C subfamily serine protease
MNFIDVFIILFFISALVRGVELGLARQFFSTTGIIGGLFLGVFIQSKVIRLAHTTDTKALLSLLVIIASIGLVSAAGEYSGARLKLRIEKAKVRGLNTVDRTLGSILAGVTLLAAVWLGATIFTNTPNSWLQKQIKSSVVIAQLNKSLPSAPSLVTRLGHLIDPNGFPNVFTGLEPAIDTSRPLPSIGDLDTAVQKARASTVKVEGEGCGGVSQGSGFVADTSLVVTNAHVVAGVKQPSVLDGAGRHRAQVIFFDPNLDMAILRTSGLTGRPLLIKGGTVVNGTPAVILGYPGGGDFTAGPAAIINSFRAVGRNIYNQGETTREVYSLKGTVRPGNSGGPLVDQDGEVVGMIFAESTAYDTVGYALTTDSILTNFNNAKSRQATVATGSCTQ